MKDNDSTSDVLIYAILLVALFFGIKIVYTNNAEVINSAIMIANKYLLLPFAWIPNSDAGKITEHFFWDSPWYYDWDKMILLTRESGKYWRWILCPPLLYMAYQAYRYSSVKDMFQRNFTMRTLLQNNVEAFPCMAPVAFIDILKLPLHTGYWRVDETILQFAVKHSLILDKNDQVVDPDLIIDSKTQMSNERSPLLVRKNVHGKNINEQHRGLHIDKDKATAVIVKQIGEPFTGTQDLPAHIKGLAAAFMAFGMGDKKTGQGLLNHMSLSYKYDKETGKPLSLDIGNATELLKKLENEPRILDATQYHTSFVSVWMVALFNLAHEKSGVIASSQFIWLRPMDRLMFGTLNQVGGRRPWVESIAPWTHYEYEKMARQPIYTPQIGKACEDIARELVELGFIDETLVSPPENR